MRTGRRLQRAPALEPLRLAHSAALGALPLDVRSLVATVSSYEVTVSQGLQELTSRTAAALGRQPVRPINPSDT
jgi:hypothetical protein